MVTKEVLDNLVLVEGDCLELITGSSTSSGVSRTVIYKGHSDWHLDFSGAHPGMEGSLSLSRIHTVRLLSRGCLT